MEKCRIIYSIECELEPLPGSPPGASAAIVLPLNRDGMAICRNGRPRPPERRTIDLRVRDFVMVDKQWRKVLGIRAYRENWIAPERGDEPGEGYVVQPVTLA